MKTGVSVLASLAGFCFSAFAWAPILAAEVRLAQSQNVEHRGPLKAEWARAAVEQGKQLLERLPEKSDTTKAATPTPTQTPPSSVPSTSLSGAPSPAAPAPSGTSSPGAEAVNLYARINQIATTSTEWPLVTLYVSVSDLQGHPIQGLQIGDFVVDEQGTLSKPVSVKTFAESEGGMAVLLVLDASGSMRGLPFQEAKRGVDSFLALLGPKDRAALMVLHDEVRLPAQFTSQIEDVKAKVNEAEPTAKVTLLYDGLAKAVDEIDARSSTLPTRKAIIVMSDGRDEGSTKKLEDVRDRALAANVPIYSVGFTRIGAQYLPNLRRISDLTGGLYLDAHAPRQLTEVYAQIFEHLKSLYVLTFRATAIRPDGQVHMLGVRVTSQGIQADAPMRAFTAPLIAVQPPTPTPVDSRTWLWAWLVVLAILGAAALAVWWWFSRRLRPQKCAACGNALPPNSAECAVCRTPIPQPTFGRLVVRNGTGKGAEFPLSGTDNAIGIGNDNQVVLAGTGIALQHARISVNGKQYELTDSGSEIGTYVNGKRVSQRYLRDKDVVKIGDVELIFEMRGMRNP